MCTVTKCICEAIPQTDLANWITAIATCATAAVAWIQLRRINATDSSRFLLELRDSFSEKRRWKIHCAIRNHDNEFLKSNDASVDDYLGLFEICEVMIDKGTITVNDFKNFYFYRLEYILDNSFILEKLLNEKASYWRNISKLFKRFPELKEEYYETPEQILFWEKIEDE